VLDGKLMILDLPRYPGWPRRTGMGGGCDRRSFREVGRGSPRHGRWAARTAG
jgi:hypothetical protein